MTVPKTKQIIFIMLIIFIGLIFQNIAGINFENPAYFLSELFFVLYYLFMTFLALGKVDKEDKERKSLKKISEEHVKKITESRALIRQDALNMVSKYLVLNGSIWKNLKIINQHCSIELKKNGKTIVIKELEGDLRWSEFIDIYNKDLINSFCYNFDEETTYDDLLKLRDELNVSVLDSSEKKKKFSKQKEKFEVEEAEPKLNDDRNVDL